MAKYHGKTGVVKISSTAVAEVTGWDYEDSVELAESTAAGAAGKTYMAGIADGQGTVTCRHSPAPSPDAGQALIVKGATLTLNLYPAGETSSYVRYQGSVIVKSVKRSADLSKVGEFSFQFQGVLTEGVVP
ncbi:hypothetical protein FJ251_08820 [bacterium]|nr:hypothetical protein [bacterium]